MRQIYPEWDRLTCREPLLRINHLADCHIAAKFTCNKQANQELRGWTLSLKPQTDGMRILTKSGHRRRMNNHSCFLGGGPVPFFRLSAVLDSQMVEK